MLAVVEHQQDPLVAEERDQPGKRIVDRHRDLQRRRERRRQPLLIDDGSEVDEAHAVGERFEQFFGGGERKRGLADATRARDGDEAAQRHQSGQRGDGFGTADHRGQADGKIVRARHRRVGARIVRGVRALHRRDETVATPRHVGNEACPLVTVSERLSQCRDVRPQAGLFDDRPGPHAGLELLAADDFAGTFDEGRQQIERTAAQAHRLVAFEQLLAHPKESKRAECERLLRAFACAVGHALHSTFGSRGASWVGGRCNLTRRSYPSSGGGRFPPTGMDAGRSDLEDGLGQDPAKHHSPRR